jgi:hypothetical protein
MIKSKPGDGEWMNRVYIFVVIFIVLLTGCKNINTDGDFVVVQGIVKAETGIVDSFVSATQKGNRSSIRIVQYTVEGDPIITTVTFDGKKYFGTVDATRDKFGSSGVREFAYPYLKVFEDDGSTIVILVNDNSITQSDYIKSMLSSDSKDWIDHQVLCSYFKD